MSINQIRLVHLAQVKKKKGKPEKLNTRPIRDLGNCSEVWNQSKEMQPPRLFLSCDQLKLFDCVISMSQGISWSNVQEIQLLFHNLHRRQHRQPAKPQKHNQMVREFHTEKHKHTRL